MLIMGLQAIQLGLKHNKDITGCGCMETEVIEAVSQQYPFSKNVFHNVK